MGAKEALHAQLEGERRRLQQLEHQHHQQQQLEQQLQGKVASLVAAAAEREREHGEVLVQMQQQFKQQQHAVKAEGSGGQLNRMASVERSLSEGELAQQVSYDG